MNELEEDLLEKKESSSSMEGWVRYITLPPFEPTFVCPMELSFGLIQVKKDFQVIYHNDRPYRLPTDTFFFDGHLYSIASQTDCPFRIYGWFYIEPRTNRISIYNCELWFHEGLFLQHMNQHGTFPKELQVSRLLRWAMTCCCDPEHCSETIRSRSTLTPSAVEWMMQLENTILTNSNSISTDLTYLPMGKTGWVYDRIRDVFTRRPMTQPTHETYQGGILENPLSSERMAFTLQLCQKMKSAASLKNQFHRLWTDSLHHEGTLLLHATLIIVPYDVTAQWDQAIQQLQQQTSTKKRKPLQIIKLLCAQDFFRTTWKDLVNADLVLTTYQFLRSKRYLDRLQHFVQSMLGDIETTALSLQKILFTATRTAHHKMADTLPDMVFPLQCYYWRRIVYDNVEQVFVSTNRSKRNLQSPQQTWIQMSGLCHWGLTCRLQIGPAAGWLQHYASICKHSSDHQLWNPQFVEQLCTTCFFSCHQMSSPHIPHHTHWIMMSPLEQRFYDYHCDSGMITPDIIQLCTYYNLHAVRNSPDSIQLQTLEYVIDALKLQKLEYMDMMQSDIQYVRKRLNSLEEEADREIKDESKDEDEEERRLEKYHRLQCRYEILEKDIQNLYKSIDYFEQLAKDLSSPESESKSQKCPICFEENADTLTICGHMFCRMCLTQQLDIKRFCPICKQALFPTEAFQINEMGTKNTYGTKFTVVLRSVKDWNKNAERVVVFSQYLPLLHILRMILLENEIPSVLLGGNTKTRQKAISSVETGQVCVLLVHLESLSCAVQIHPRHLVFLHSLVGTNHHRLKLYNQAIQMVTADDSADEHWFLAQNTIEVAFH